MTHPAHDGPLHGRSVFVSASIPDPTRWTGPFDPWAITDSVVAVARAVLTAGGRVVTAAHPTIAPLLLYVAAEQPVTQTPAVTIYQSEVFEGYMPEAIGRFQSDGVGVVMTTPKVGDELPDPRHAPNSLGLMRRTMFDDPMLVAAVFIGGMRGIPLEHALFTQLHPQLPTYAFGQPGGEAALLVAASPPELRAPLADGVIYPALARSIVADLARGMS